MRGQGARRVEQGAVPDGLRRGGHLPREGAQNHAGTERGIRQHRARKGRLYPLPRSGAAVPLAAEARRLAAARKAGITRREHETRTARREDREDRRIPPGGTADHGPGGQGGHFDQRSAPDGRHFAGRPQRGAGPLHLEGFPFTENPFGGREEAPQAHRCGGAAEEFRRHHPHGGHGGQGTRTSSTTSRPRSTAGARPARRSRRTWRRLRRS